MTPRLEELALLACARMRAKVLSLRGATVGPKTSIGPRCVIRGAPGVRIGGHVVLEQEVFLKLVEDEAALEIGDFTFIGRGTELDLMERISVGRHTLIAPRCFITDHVHGTDPALRMDEQPCRSAPVRIGDDVWLGTGTVVLPGVTIGDGAIVGANSVVTRDVEAMTVIAGAPARLVRLRAAADDQAAGSSRQEKAA